MDESARWVLSLIHGLPADAAAWTEVEPAPRRTSDPAAIQQFFSRHVKGG